jgi:hypothetical protein
LNLALPALLNGAVLPQEIQAYHAIHTNQNCETSLSGMSVHALKTLATPSHTGIVLSQTRYVHDMYRKTGQSVKPEIHSLTDL